MQEAEKHILRLKIISIFFSSVLEKSGKGLYGVTKQRSKLCLKADP